jgi:hypothetical protein
VTPDAAQAELEAALGQLGGVRTKIEADKKRAEAAVSAREKLARAAENYHGPTSDEAARLAAKAKKQADARRKIVEDLRKELKKAEADLTEAVNLEVQTARDENQAIDHEDLVRAWEDQIAEGEITQEGDSDDVLMDAQERVDAARKLVANVAIRDKMAAQIAEAKEQAKLAAAAEKQSLALRDAAKGVDEVLSDAVAGLGTKLYVLGGRLLIDTPKRGPTYFAELSAGERAKVVLEIAVDQAAKAGDGERLGVCVVPQEVFEGLAPDVQEWLRDLCRERRVVAYTAQVTNARELRAEVS